MSHNERLGQAGHSLAGGHFKTLSEACGSAQRGADTLLLRWQVAEVRLDHRSAALYGKSREHLSAAEGALQCLMWVGSFFATAPRSGCAKNRIGRNPTVRAVFLDGAVSLHELSLSFVEMPKNLVLSL